MDRLMGEIDPTLLDADICWMVTDNLRGLLALEAGPGFDTSTGTGLEEYLWNNLLANRLLIGVQDPD